MLSDLGFEVFFSSQGPSFYFYLISFGQEFLMTIQVSVAGRVYK